LPKLAEASEVVRLRRGIGRHRDGGGTVADRGHVVACAGSSHPDHRRPRQSRADGGRDGSWDR
jgi:hypothetical protein